MFVAALLFAAALDDGRCAAFEAAGATTAVSAEDRCPAGTLGEGATVELAAGGYVVLSLAAPSSLAGEGAPPAARSEQVCAFAGPGSVVLRLHHDGAAGGSLGFAPTCAEGASCAPPAGLRCHRATALERKIAVERASPPQAPPPDDEEDRLLLLDLEPQGVPKRTAGVVTDLVRAELGRLEGLETIGIDDVELLMDDARAAALDRCDEESAACLAEAADALGARYHVSGALSTSERYLVATLSLVDSASTEVLSRVELRGLDIVDLSRVLPAAVHNLVAPLTGERARPIPPPLSARTADAAETVGGASVAGAVTGAGLFALVAVPAVAIAALMATSASLVGGGVLPSLLIAPFVLPCAPFACACAATGSVVGDLVFGYDASAFKAALLFLTGAAASILAVLFAGGMVGALFLGYLLVTSTFGLALPAVLAYVVGIAGLMAVFATMAGGVGLTTGMAFDLLTPLLAEEPPAVVERSRPKRPQRY